MWVTHTLERLINTSTIVVLLISVPGGRWAEPTPAAQGTGGHLPWEGHSSLIGHPHSPPSPTHPTHILPHSLRLGNLDPAVHHVCPALGCRTKPKSPEKTTQTWGEGANSAPAVVPAGNQFVYHQYYSKMTLNKTMLVEDLLCTDDPIHGPYPAPVFQLEFLGLNKCYCLKKRWSQRFHNHCYLQNFRYLCLK